MTSKYENVGSTETKTRKQRRTAKEAARAERVQTKEKTKKGATNQKHIKKRLIPIWLRLVIVGILLIISLLAGLMVGYGVIGDGAALDALKLSTWKHLVDLVVGEATN